MTGRKKAIVAIDPGRTGGYAILIEGGNILLSHGELPHISRLRVMSGKELVDIGTLVRQIHDVSEVYTIEIEKVYIEQVGSMPGNSATKMFGFGMGVGILIGGLTAAGYLCETIAPSKWQNDAHKGRLRSESCKKRSLAVVEETFGLKLAKKHNGIADAICLGIHAARKGTK